MAVSSLRFDRGLKASICARAGVPAYFVVDVEGRSVEACTEPEQGRYTQSVTYRGGVRIGVPGFSDVTFSADEPFAT